MSARLTDLAIQRKYRPRAARYEVADGAQAGLYLVVQPSGHRSFCVRYRHAGRPKKLTLKAGVSLADARRLASEAMYTVEKGADPRVAKKAAKEKEAAAAVNTVRAVCENYLKREGKKLRTLRQQQGALRRLVYPVLGDKLISDVRRSDINRMLDRIEDTSGERSAELSLQHLRKIFNWFAIQTDDFHNPIIRGMSRYKTADHRRKRTLGDDELQQIWQATETDDAFSALLRFLLLTGARRSEAAGLTWGEITGNAWLLPAARNKNKTDLRRPLSEAALAVVNARPRFADSDFVFTASGRRPLHFGRCKRDFDKVCDIAPWRLHDARRTARTLLSRANVAADTAERILGHSLPPIRATYDTHDYFQEMEAGVEKLAAQIERIVNPTDNVRLIRRREG